MPGTCCAVGCSYTQVNGRDLKLNRIPVDESRRKLWVQRIGRKDWQPTQHTRLCSLHFVSGKPVNDPAHLDYVPSVFPKHHVCNVMVRRCWYDGCTSDSRDVGKDSMKGVVWIAFPKPQRDLEKCKRWIHACGLQDFHTEEVRRWTYVCSKHFVGGSGPTQAHPDPIPVHNTPAQELKVSRLGNPPRPIQQAAKVSHVGTPTPVSNETNMSWKPPVSFSYIRSKKDMDISPASVRKSIRIKRKWRGVKIEDEHSPNSTASSNMANKKIKTENGEKASMVAECKEIGWDFIIEDDDDLPDLTEITPSPTIPNCEKRRTRNGEEGSTVPKCEKEVLNFIVEEYDYLPDITSFKPLSNGKETILAADYAEEDQNHYLIPGGKNEYDHSSKNTPSSTMPNNTRKTRNDDEESTVAQCKEESTVAQCEEESTVAQCKEESTVAQCEEESTVAQCDEESTVAQCEEESTVAQCDEESTVAQCEEESTVAQCEEESTVAQCEEESTVAQCEEESTVAQCDEESTVAQCDEESTVAQCEEESTVAQCEEESTVAQCEEESTVAQCEEESTVAQCEEESTVAQCEEENTVAQCEEESTVAQCDEESMVAQCDEKSTVAQCEEEENWDMRVEDDVVNCIYIKSEIDIKEEPESYCSTPDKDTMYYRLESVIQQPMHHQLLLWKESEPERVEASQQTEVSKVNADLKHSAQQTEELYYREVTQQTDMSTFHIAQLQVGCQHFLSECISLKDKLQFYTLDKEAFVSDNDKVKCFTGLDTYSVMMVIFKHLNIEKFSPRGIDPFCRFVMTLLRFRYNLPTKLLGYIFKVSYSSVRGITMSILNALDTRLVPALIIWPEREQLQKSCPFLSELTPRCLYIIEIMEILIERSNNVDARTQTYSATKSHYTMKYLVAVTPKGAVTYISKAWGGASTDVAILENCGFLDLLQSGDIILASKNFSVIDKKKLFCEKLNMPAFTIQDSKLHQLDRPVITKLLTIILQLHRILGGAVYRYAILKDTINLSWLERDKTTNLSILDKIVRVTCALASTAKYNNPFDVVRNRRKTMKVKSESDEESE